MMCVGKRGAGALNTYWGGCAARIPVHGEPFAVGPSRAGMTLCKTNSGFLRTTVRARRLDHLRLIPSS